MALLWTTPIKPAFPVNFYSGGDTTKNAFHKHIQEIERIYDLLNALDAGKLSSGEVDNSIGNLNTSLTNHINSTKPHPNWKPSFSDISGTLDASNVVGALTNATIAHSNVTGLEDYVKGLIESEGGGVDDEKLEDNGYIELSNGLIIQWGTTDILKASVWTETNNYARTAGTRPFKKAFTDKCYSLSLQVNAPDVIYTRALGSALSHNITTSSRVFYINETMFSFEIIMRGFNSESLIYGDPSVNFVDKNNNAIDGEISAEYIAIGK